METRDKARQLFQLMREKKLTLSFAESCTGGLAASLMTDIPGSSHILMGSVVSYSNYAKTNILGVSAETIDTHGVFSSEVASEMALGAKKHFNSDIAISFTGVTGPTGGTKETPVGTVFIGFATDKAHGAERVQLSGERLELKELFVNEGIKLAIGLT